MATPQITREQLIIDLAKIRDSHADWVSADERRRNEFAKAFGWFIGFNAMGSRSEAPSWEQIFVQVGKLLVLEELKQKIVPINIDFNPHK